MAKYEGSGFYELWVRDGSRAVRVKGPDPLWVDRRSAELLRWLGAAPGAAGGGPRAAGEAAHDGPSRKPPSLVELIQQVGPEGGVEHVITVGYYLERYSHLQGGFRRRDVAEAFEAAGYRHSNPGVPMGTARQRGLLMNGDEHEKVQLTGSAVRWVERRLADAGASPTREPG